MTKIEFNERVNEICAFIENNEFDDMSDELKARKITDVFVYGSWCERNFELNLQKYKRQTTYTRDFSNAEWLTPICGMKAISDLMRMALNDWHDNVEWFGEIVIVVNMKSWEHAARGNNNFGVMYADLYYMVKDLFFDCFEGTDKQDDAVKFYFDYID